MPRDRERNRYREKRSSSYSSESSYERKKSKSKHKRRTRSRDRSESNIHRRKRSVSRSKHRRRSYSRSVSRDRYDGKSKRRSSSRSRSKRSKYSRERSRSRSSSRNHSKSNKKHKRHSRSKSRSNSFDLEPKTQRVNLDDTDTKVEKAIKAAEAAGLTMTKLPTYDYKEVEVKEDMPTIHDRNLLDELNSDSFVQKSFTSSKNKKQSQNIVIDLNAQTVKVPEAKIEPKMEDSIINFDEIPSPDELKEMWIKKLYLYRKKVLKGEIS
ncbi:serine/threonine-protein kinase fray2-like [Zerene cesonia]|uniref:serine/threonine-protein kinase fray2-like n=1 Tax=Zerene cesonia TaxID=33412 RepID=UPI0018E580A6|nr:serine/threonine-protein kinase fray2-like [Zerene cesonia]